MGQYNFLQHVGENMNPLSLIETVSYPASLLSGPIRFLAQQTPEPGSWEMLGAHLIAAIVFSLVGVIVFFGCLLLMEKLTPFSITREIGEEHNVAVAIIVGAIVLGISIIIAAAILG